jgi:site-specific DNA recombinase
MRCAIYARYSSDLQRESSIEDQIRRCREFAERRGWNVVEEFVRHDAAVSGAAIAGRDALTSLVEDAKRKPRPFDRILVDDTSRLARNMGDCLRVVEILQFHSVPISAVSQGIDTEQKSTRPLLAFQGMMDEQYLVGLAEKVHRGQEGRVLKGLHPGGRCYGYTNVPIEDPTRQAKYGRPAVSGVRLEINAEEAEAVRRIFQMYGDGIGLASIAKKFNEEGVPAPQPPRTRLVRAWCPSSIREILRNERYHGVFVWNRTQKQRNPETGRKISKRRPKSEWRRVDVPEWRIVSEELWNGAHARIGFVNERLSACRLGGLSRTEQSRKYLFSGLLRCGDCGSRMVIVSGGGKRGYVRYGCPSHRYRGICDNALTIRRERLEAQLLRALEERLVKPDMMAYALKQFSAQLQQRLAQIRKRAPNSSVAALQRQRRELQDKATKLANAIEAAGHSPTLLARLASVEAELGRVDERIKSHKPVDFKATTEQIRDFATKNVLNLQGLLGGDVTRAKAALMKHVQQLVLTPRDLPSGPVFEVSGAFDLLGNKYVMPVVARGGIEPPTPAFSGLRATIPISLIQNNLTRFRPWKNRFKVQPNATSGSLRLAQKNPAAPDFRLPRAFGRTLIHRRRFLSGVSGPGSSLRIESTSRSSRSRL